MVRKPSHAAAAVEGENKERKGLWSPEEDERLFTQITCHGVSTWSSVAQLAGLRRSGKSCRLRWMNYLRPDLKKEPISKREEEVIISLQQSLGNRWSVIAAKMPGRTDNEIKNYWNSRIRKRLNAAADKASRDGGNSNSAVEERAPATEEKEEPTDNNAVRLPIPARFPIFACQLPDVISGGGTPSTTTTTTTTTADQQNSVSVEESEASVGGDGSEDAAAAAGDDSNMVHDYFFSFDELDYPGADTDLLLMDVPGVLDAWESELCSPNSIRSMIN